MGGGGLSSALWLGRSPQNITYAFILKKLLCPTFAERQQLENRKLPAHVHAFPVENLTVYRRCLIQLDLEHLQISISIQLEWTKQKEKELRAPKVKRLVYICQEQHSMEKKIQRS